MQSDDDRMVSIKEAAEMVGVEPFVLRFWETKFPKLSPVRSGGRGDRYYRPQHVKLAQGIMHLTRVEGYSIRGVQRLFKVHGAEYVRLAARRPEKASAA